MGEPDTRLHASHRTPENSCLNLRKPSRGQREITVQGHVRDKTRIFAIWHSIGAVFGGRQENVRGSERREGSRYSEYLQDVHS